MATMLLTKVSVDDATPLPRRYEIFDTDLKGFGLRVSPSGEKTWIVRYRPGDGGRSVSKKIVTIGKVGTLTPKQAREKAAKLLSAVKLGGDPAEEKAARRATITITELAKSFIDSHVEPKRGERTKAHYQDILNRIVVPELGSMKVDKVTRADVARLHLKWRTTPFQANRMLAVVGSMFSYGARVGLVRDGHNPARGVDRYDEEGRERYLSAEELERLGAAIREAETDGILWATDESAPGAKHLPKDRSARRTKIAPQAAAALRLLILTGARLGEILNLRWTEVDLDRGLLLLPKSKTGKKTIVLNAPALAVLANLPRTSVYVIPGEPVVLQDGTLEDRPRNDLKRPWAVVSSRAGLEGVRLHDLRHTFASFGAGGGLGLPIIGKLLGHTNASTTQRYAHVASDPLRKASDKIAESIAAAMGDRGPTAHEVTGSVTVLRKRT